MRRWIWITLVSLLMTPVAAFGQMQPQEGTSGSQLNFIWAIPQGDFADHIDRHPTGASFLFGGQVPGAPLFLGTELSILNYGTQQHLELRSIEDVPVQALRVASSHNIAMGHLVARMHLPIRPIQPYIDVLGGIRSFVSNTKIDSDVVVFRRGLNSKAHHVDWSFSYGVGGGLNLTVYERPDGFSNRPVTMSINVGVRYLLGTSTDFVQADDVREIGDRFEFETTRSRTDVLIPQVGVRVSL